MYDEYNDADFIRNYRTKIRYFVRFRLLRLYVRLIFDGVPSTYLRAFSTRVPSIPRNETRVI